MRTLILTSIAALMPCAAVAQQAHVFLSDRISVAARGSGSAGDVILVPGLASSRDVWDSVAARMVGTHRVHLVQVHGFAGMPPRANATGLVSAAVAEELARYIRERKLVRPAVIGHSMGGTIGLMLAARHPDLVGRLLVEDMPPFMGAMFAPTADSARVLANVMRDTLRAQHRRGAPGMFEQMYPTMTGVAERRAMLMKGLSESHRPTVINAFHELIVTDLRPELAKITAPVTVLYVAPAGQGVTPEQLDAMMREQYANLRNVRLIRVEDANHFIHFDQLDRFMREVEAFMRR